MMKNLLLMLTVMQQENRWGVMFWHYGYLLGIPLMLIGMVAALLAAVRLINMTWDAEVWNAPLRESNQIKIDCAGKLILSLEIPLLTWLPFNGLDYRLTRVSDGLEITLQKMFLGAQATRRQGGTSAYNVRQFEIDAAGDYLLRVSDLETTAKHQDYNFSVSKPLGGKLFLYIIIAVTGGLMFIGGLNFTLISLNANH